MTTLEKISQIAIEIEKLLKEGKTLQEITKITYERREAGENMIYCGWLNKNQGSNSCLVANPTAKQKEFKEFFSEKADGTKSITKYVFYVFQDGVQFQKRTKINGEIISSDIIKNE